LRCWLATSRLLQRSSFKRILNSKEIAEHLIYLWHFNWLFQYFFFKNNVALFFCSSLRCLYWSSEVCRKHFLKLSSKCQNVIMKYIFRDTFRLL
jgi:hypothetical protein